VTVVGMDNAIADVVSLVSIMQQRGIGEHEGKLSKDKEKGTNLNGVCFIEVETFTLQPTPKRYTSGIQVKLHSI
ncbi:hypothetical protein K492DRAFT_130549, partial [Lichtheimia hyalospora FSU 10163]